jgi:hypothetical protein
MIKSVVLWKIEVFDENSVVLEWQWLPIVRVENLNFILVNLL